jgi:hypothetical protein
VEYWPVEAGCSTESSSLGPAARITRIVSPGAAAGANQSSGEKPVVIRSFPNPKRRNLTYLVRPVPFLAIHEIRLALTFFPNLTSLVRSGSLLS